MKIAFANKPLFSASPTGWILGTLKPSVQSGYSIIVLESGKTFSMQPDGSYSDRDAGTDNVWERCKVNGNILAFSPNNIPFGILFVEL